MHLQEEREVIFFKKIFTRRGTVGGWEWLIYEVHSQGENKKIWGLNLEGKVVSAPPRRARSPIFKKIFTRRGTVGGWEWLIYEVHSQGEN